jgi:TRAP-type C4-dicarboxylate transport system permease small subunit
MSINAIIQTLDRVGRTLEDALLIGLLGLMIVLASSQIVLRNALDFGFVWGDELLRILVLWVAMTGAVAASRTDRHIMIDVFSRFLPKRINSALKVMTDMFTSIVCGFAAWYSWTFVAMEMEFGSSILGGLPAWPFQMVLPVSFGLIAWRYLLHGMKDAAAVMNVGQEEQES